MLDFNHRSTLGEQISALIDAALIAEHQGQTPRRYLGASRGCGFGSGLHHHYPKTQPFSVGFFFARNPSVGAVPGLCLASGTLKNPPFPARRGPLSSTFSLVASRAVARPLPVFTEGYARPVVVEYWRTGGDR